MQLKYVQNQNACTDFKKETLKAKALEMIFVKRCHLRQTELVFTKVYPKGRLRSWGH